MPELREQTFWAWMMVVDAEVIRLSGVSVHDLGDQCFADWFEDGLTAKEAARLTLESEEFPFGKETETNA